MFRRTVPAVSSGGDQSARCSNALREPLLTSQSPTSLSLQPNTVAETVTGRRANRLTRESRNLTRKSMPTFSVPRKPYLAPPAPFFFAPAEPHFTLANRPHMRYCWAAFLGTRQLPEGGYKFRNPYSGWTALRDLNMQQEPQKKDFFISYNKADISWAEWMAWELEETGYQVVIQAWDFRPGFNFVIQMQRASAQAERVIAVLSPNYLNAEFTQPEWATAFARDPGGQKGLLLPVRVSECDLEGLLPQIVYIDLVGLPEEKAKDKLLRGVKTERAKPAVKPPFPGIFPGLLPPIWNIPHQRNPNFTGREDLLAEMRVTFTAGQPDGMVQAVYGVGGVGKTQVVLEYVYRHADKYRIVWWLRAEDSSTLAADYASLYAKLELSPKDITDQSTMVNAVREWLAQNGDWLLIFDNARSGEDVRPYLPQSCAGNVLITSRNQDWAAFAHERRLQPLAPEDAVNFLLMRTA